MLKPTQPEGVRPPGHPGRAKQAGQSIIEFSIMVIFITVLLMGVLDLGRAYFTYLALKDAAGEGAYYGSAFPECVGAASVVVDGDLGGDSVNDDSNTACADPNNIYFRVLHSAPQGGLVDWADRSAEIAVDLPCGAAPPSCDMTAGQVLTVSVQYSYQMLTPFVGAIANGQSLTLTAQSSAVIIRVPDCTGTECK